MKLLTELLNNPLPYKIVDTRNSFNATFSYKDHNYVIEADKDIGSNFVRKGIEDNGGSIRGMSPKWFDEDEYFYIISFHDIDG